jgi:hypothetical protein
MRAEHARHPASSDIIMGKTDRLGLIDGWYRLEELPEPVRWTSPRATFEIDTNGRTTLCVSCLTFKPGLDSDPVRGSIQFGDVTVGTFSLSELGWHDLRFPLPSGISGTVSGGRTITGAIVTDNPWRPSDVLDSSVFEAVLGRPKVIAGSRDTRELGIVVRRIWAE